MCYHIFVLIFIARNSINVGRKVSVVLNAMCRNYSESGSHSVYVLEPHRNPQGGYKNTQHTFCHDINKSYHTTRH